MPRGQVSANNRIAKNTALLFAKSGIVLVVGLYASRVLLQKLGIEDYGVYHVVGSVVLMFMSVSGHFRPGNYEGTGGRVPVSRIIGVSNNQ